VGRPEKIIPMGKNIQKGILLPDIGSCSGKHMKYLKRSGQKRFRMLLWKIFLWMLSKR
jgi:hypothetical protein